MDKRIINYFLLCSLVSGKKHHLSDEIGKNPEYPILNKHQEEVLLVKNDKGEFAVKDDIIGGKKEKRRGDISQPAHVYIY
jgi:hypothetical protein